MSNSIKLHTVFLLVNDRWWCDANDRSFIFEKGKYWLLKEFSKPRVSKKKNQTTKMFFHSVNHSIQTETHLLSFLLYYYTTACSFFLVNNSTKNCMSNVINNNKNKNNNRRATITTILAIKQVQNNKQTNKNQPFLWSILKIYFFIVYF